MIYIASRTTAKILISLNWILFNKPIGDLDKMCAQILTSSDWFYIS